MSAHHTDWPSVAYEARFFFCQPGSEGVANFAVPIEDVIASLVFLYKPRDQDLKRTVRHLIESDERYIARTRTESVVADVGLAKICGGLGASHPEDTVILFKSS
jgi:hypothetical protein